MEHEWLPEESLDGTLANLFLRSSIVIALRWRNTVALERKHGFNEMFAYKEIIFFLRIQKLIRFFRKLLWSAELRFILYEPYLQTLLLSVLGNSYWIIQSRLVNVYQER